MKNARQQQGIKMVAITSRLFFASFFAFSASYASPGDTIYSGIIMEMNGKPYKNAGVILKSSNTLILADSLGQWAITEQSTNISKHKAATQKSGHLRYENGRLKISFSGFDISGRNEKQFHEPAKGYPNLGRTSASKIDTLHFYYVREGKWLSEIATDTITAPRRGILTHINPLLRSEKIFGNYMDPRDSTYYHYIKIGNYTWMAENLMFRTDSSAPRMQIAQDARYYTWADAMTFNDSCNYKPCSNLVTEPHKGICPSGWHIPNNLEWMDLGNTAGGRNLAGYYLKHTDQSRNITDPFGFCAYAYGWYDISNQRTDYGSSYYWWGANEATVETDPRVGYAKAISLYVSNSRIFGLDSTEGVKNKRHKLTVRCVKDTP